MSNYRLEQTGSTAAAQLVRSAPRIVSESAWSLASANGHSSSATTPSTVWGHCLTFHVGPAAGGEAAQSQKLTSKALLKLGC